MLGDVYCKFDRLLKIVKAESKRIATFNNCMGMSTRSIITYT